MHAHALIGYLAGFFDGEGCVIATENETSLQVSQGMMEPLELLTELFGGAARLVRHSSSGRPVYDWRVSGSKATHFAKTILPYTIVKRKQLECFIVLREAIETGRKVDRQLFYDAIKELKQS